MAELDRNRPFDRVYGFVADGDPYFFQDGKAFTSEGVEIISEEEVITIPESALEEPKKRGRKKAAVDEAVESPDENHDLL